MTLKCQDINLTEKIISKFLSIDAGALNRNEISRAGGHRNPLLCRR